MTTIEYAIQMYNLYTPLKHSINQTVIDHFLRLQNEENDFSKFIKSNKDTINQITIVNINDYIDQTVLTTQQQKNIPEINQLYQTSQEAGKLPAKPLQIQDSSIKLFFLKCIIFYLYSSNDLTNDSLPKAREIKRQSGGNGNGIEDIHDVSGAKKSERLVFMFKIANSPLKYCMKIVNNDDAYINEIKIYQRLKKINQTDGYIADRVLDIKGYGFVSPNINNTKSFDIIIDNETINITSMSNASMISAIINYQELNPVVIYFITPKNDDYVTLESLMSKSSGYKTVEKNVCDLCSELIRLLYYLNSNYDFVHWDLHFDNLLVLKSATNFLLYDFDLSTIDTVPSNEIGTRITAIHDIQEQMDSNDFLYYGFYYDLINFMLRFNDEIRMKLYDECSDELIPRKMKSIIEEIQIELINNNINTSTDYYQVLALGVYNIMVEVETKNSDLMFGGEKVDYKQKYKKYKLKYLKY